ncbi:MAG TPA: GGDEF domain-containing phosphodiesterase [Sulfurovum sp.]
MNPTLEKLGHFINQTTLVEYAFLCIFILFVALSFYIYYLKQTKNKLSKTLDSNIKVFQKAFDISDDAILILSDQNKVVYANNTLVRLLELAPTFLDKILKTEAEIKVKKEWVKLQTFIEEKRTGAEKSTQSYPRSMLKISKRDEIPVNLYLGTVRMNMPEEMLCDVITIQDLSKDKELTSAILKHQLTDMPNQLQLYRDLPSFYSKVHLEKNKLALILMRIDNFAMLRSVIGNEQANTVLKKFASYLQTLSTGSNISVYHTFDNHFLLTVTNIHSLDEIKLFVEDIQKKLASFYKMEDVNLYLTASAGMAIYPESGSARKLLDYAYKALSIAEKEGDGKIHIYIPEKFDSNYNELKLHNDMQGALRNGEFEVYYQPVIKVANEEVVGAEALIRWKHPQYGLIPPIVFISLMEKTGFIIKLGQYILDEVLKQQKRWERFNFKQVEVSINVSMVEINSGDFVHHVERKLTEHQVDPELIKFEITEGIAMSNEAKTVKDFLALKKLGVGISLDDFGTGYTSFSYLKKFPADNLKIDKSLVDYILTNEEDQRIVRAIIELAHTLGMKIVVEGIENRQMVEMVASFGCDYMQGYYFSKPLPVFEFQKLLR